ncbi:MAG: phosphatase PAP2 family protein [Patescibacteria group bacterium]
MHNINTQILEFVNGAAGYYHPLDIFFETVTSSILIGVLGAVIAAYYGIYLPYYRKDAVRKERIKDAAVIGGGVIATGIAIVLLKIFIAYPRPFTVLANLRVLVSLPDDYSFPSGHSAITMALATGVYCYNKKLGMLLFAFAFVVGMARIYVGVHYPLDVAVGFMLGFLIPKLIQHFFVKKESLQLQ